MKMMALSVTTLALGACGALPVSEEPWWHEPAQAVQRSMCMVVIASADTAAGSIEGALRALAAVRHAVNPCVAPACPTAVVIVLTGGALTGAVHGLEKGFIRAGQYCDDVAVQR